MLTSYLSNYRHVTAGTHYRDGYGNRVRVDSIEFGEVEFSYLDDGERYVWSVSDFRDRFHTSI